MSDVLTRLLEQRPWLLADGGMGSGLFERGLESGYAPELWNVEHPDRIAAVHRSFIDAGADLILTNTFGGTRHRLKLHQAEGRVAELNSRAAHVARDAAAGVGREIVIAGSMGPTGEILEPIGPLTSAEAKDAFAEQAEALAHGGVDVLWIETLSSVEELDAAILGAKSTGLPIVTTFSFDTNGRTMMGITPAQLAAIQQRTHVLACGSNCGTGAAELVASIVNLASAAAPDALLVAKANCGIPRYVDGAIRFDGTPALMANYARLALDAGARIIGGCCGTTAQHLRAMRAALETHVRGDRPTAATIEALLGPLTRGARTQLELAAGDGDRHEGAAVPAARTARAASPRLRRAKS
jgi:5-methyltetrahydrofolate--homocysteine methyltransferase